MVREFISENFKRQNKELPIGGKKRIEFIDLAKGVCIILVITYHCHVLEIPGLRMLRMPLYFVLSGLFFKDYDGFLDFIFRKVDKILIPFIIFYFIGFSLYKFILTYWNFCPSGMENLTIDSIFYSRINYNAPIWFLCCLFVMNIMFYIIHKNIKNQTLMAFTILLCAYMGWWLSTNKLFLPLWIDTALTSMPMFYFGYLLRKTELLFPNSFDRYNIYFAIVLIGISYILIYFFRTNYIEYSQNIIVDNVIVSYVISLTMVVGVLLLCKIKKWLPVVSYCGRYSIIILVLHQLYLNLAQVLDLQGGVVLMIVFLLCWMSIPICRLLIPQFVSQKDLVYKWWKNGHSKMITTI